MTDNVYSISEIVGTSPDGVDHAVRNAIERASRTLRNLDWFEVVEVRGYLSEGEIDHFRSGSRSASGSSRKARAETGRATRPCTVRGVARADIDHPRQDPGMATYTVNERAVARARELIDARQYVLGSNWQGAQPRADQENAFLSSHSWEEYGEWHLGLTDGGGEQTKARYAFVYGDFRRIHRMGLIACHYRAAEHRHKEIELAAHELLQCFDTKTA